MQQNQSKPFHIVTIIKHAEVWNIVWNAKKKKEKNTENVVQNCQKLKIVEQCC